MTGAMTGAMTGVITGAMPGFASGEISIQNLTVQYGSKRVLNGVELTLRTGELVGLVGPNGAGKTTLLRALLGLVDVAGGEMLVGDTALSSLAVKERARLFAYLAQGGPVHWPLSVQSVVELGRVPHNNPWQAMSDADHQHIDTAIEKTGVGEFRSRIVTSLSGGERARVMLARALAADAPYLFADEPAASLDPHYQLEMMALLHEQVDEHHGGVVVMHDLNLAQHYCDRLLVLDGGELVADGKPEDVLTDELLENVFGIQVARWRDGDDSYLVPKTLSGL